MKYPYIKPSISIIATENNILAASTRITAVGGDAGITIAGDDDETPVEADSKRHSFNVWDDED